MTIKDLYDLCVNLYGSSFFSLRNIRDELIDEGYYERIGAEYGDREVISFHIVTDHNVNITIGGVR